MGPIQEHKSRITLTHFFLLAVILLLKMQSGHSAVLKGDAYEIHAFGTGLNSECLQ